MYDWAEFRHFRYLLTILELRGFRAAAEELRTSQPNLSIQAKQFQEFASVRLFRRAKSGHIRITPAGIAFQSLARELLETRDQIIDALVAIERDEIRSVIFGCASLVDPNLFQELCARHKAILPDCTVRPTFGDTATLTREILQGHLDAAMVTLPLAHPELNIELIRRDPLVVCLSQDDPRAVKTVLRAGDLQDTAAVLYDPERHPEAHLRLLELLHEVGIHIREFSRASHPSEVQSLVKQGHGFAFIRKGTGLQEGLVTRPLASVDWTVDTAVIYSKTAYPKTLPVVVKRLRKEAGLQVPAQETRSGTSKRPPQPVRQSAEQLSLLPSMALEKPKRS